MNPNIWLLMVIDLQGSSEPRSVSIVFVHKLFNFKNLHGTVYTKKWVCGDTELSPEVGRETGGNSSAGTLVKRGARLSV